MNSNESASGPLPRVVGPEFLCIGQAKAGTSWLYDMLRLDPDFWMPPIKELNFFDGRFAIRRAKRLSDKAARNLGSSNAETQKSRQNPLDDRDRRFLEHATTYNAEEHSAKEFSIDWYKKLFVPKANLVSGDMTPANARLTSDVIAAIAQALPDLRLVLFLRDPVSRFWSHFNMRQRKKLTGRGGGVSRPDAKLLSDFRKVTSVEGVVKYLHEDRTRAVSFATSIYEKWNRHFDASRMSIVFFEDVCASPERVIEKFREDLGLPGALAGKQMALADHNKKADQMKREMSDQVRAVLVDAFRDEMVRCAQVFGGPAEHWPRRYGIV